MSSAVDEARDEIVRVGTSLFARGYVHASAGNISARVGDGHLITPTDAALGFLEPAASGWSTPVANRSRAIAPARH